MPSAGLLSAESADEWADIVSRSFVPLAAHSVAPRFRATIERRVCGDVAVSWVRAGATRVVRSEALVKSDPTDDVLLSLPLVSGGVLRQAERSVGFVAGSGAIYQAAVPYELDFPGAANQLVVQVPQRALSATRRQVADTAGRSLEPTSPSLRLVGRMARELLAAPHEDLRSADLVGQALALLVDALFAPADTGRRADERTAFYHVLTADVRANAADLDLSPAAYIRSARLHLARRLLGDPGCAGLSIADIAVRAGIADQTTLARMFRANYGCSPREYREAGVERGS